MDIKSGKYYKSHLAACERYGQKGFFSYGLNTYPENLIADAAQDIYNRLSGHGLDFGAVVLILEIVESQLRAEAYSTKL